MNTSLPIIIPNQFFNQLSQKTKDELRNTSNMRSEAILRIVPDNSSIHLKNLLMQLDELIRKEFLQEENAELRKLKDSINTIKKHLK